METTMMRKCSALILIGLLIHLVPGEQAVAHASTKQQVPTVDRIKEKIAKLGVGRKARVRIKLRNGKTIKGYIDSVGQDDFRLTERDTSQTTTVAYGDVVEVKKPGGLSKGTKIAIVAGIGAIVVLGLVVNHAVHHLFDSNTPIFR